MHCKALTEGDFDRWTAALKGFIGTVQEGPLSSEPEATAQGGPMDLGSVRATVDKMRGVSLMDFLTVGRRS